MKYKIKTEVLIEVTSEQAARDIANTVHTRVKDLDRVPDNKLITTTLEVISWKSVDKWN